MQANERKKVTVEEFQKGLSTFLHVEHSHSSSIMKVDIWVHPFLVLIRRGGVYSSYAVPSPRGSLL